MQTRVENKRYSSKRNGHSVDPARLPLKDALQYTSTMTRSEYEMNTDLSIQATGVGFSMSEGGGICMCVGVV